MNKDLAFGTLTLALSAGYYWMAAGILESQLADAIGPQGLPRTYAVLLAVLSLILIARSLVRGTGLRTSKETRSPYAIGRVAGMLAIGIVYIVVVPWLGYLLSLAGLIFATTYYQGGSINRQVALVALSGAVFCWLLFVLLMRIPQPPGLWPSLL
jgi:putative tricarboxylic transport membrane protein